MPLVQNLAIGIPLRVAATGTFKVGVSTHKAGIVGILVGSMSGPTVQMYHGQSALATNTTIIAAITCTANAFTPIPAYVSGGATFLVSGADSTVDLTIYWLPLV